MNKGINWYLRKKVLERDDFTCQKCKLENETGKLLQIHHITMAYLKGKDGIL